MRRAAALHLLTHFTLLQAHRLFSDRLVDSKQRARFDGMLKAQLRSSWGHTADLVGVREISLVKPRTIPLGRERAKKSQTSQSDWFEPHTWNAKSSLTQ